MAKRMAKRTVGRSAINHRRIDVRPESREAPVRSGTRELGSPLARALALAAAGAAVVIQVGKLIAAVALLLCGILRIQTNDDGSLSLSLSFSADLAPAARANNSLARAA